MSTTNLAVQENKQVAGLRELLMAHEVRIAQNIQGALKLDQVINGTVELARADSKLQKCEPETVLLGVLAACQLGLSLNRNLGHAYLIPRKNGFLTQRMGRDVFEATFQIGYKGLLHMVREANTNIHSVSATIVYEGEPFTIRGGDQRGIDHQPSPDQLPLDDYRGAYSVIEFKDGSKADFEWMSRGDIEKIRSKSVAAKEGPWVDWTEEMIKKTVLRRHCKRLELLPKAAAAINRDEAIDLGYDGATQSYQAPRPAMPRRIGESEIPTTRTTAETATPLRPSNSPSPDESLTEGEGPKGVGSGAAGSRSTGQAGEGVPACPQCGAAMKKRKAKTGSEFYGCSTYPKCSETMTVDAYKAASQQKPGQQPVATPASESTPDYGNNAVFHEEYKRLLKEHPAAVAAALESEQVQSVDDLGGFGRFSFIEAVQKAIAQGR